MLNYKTRHIQNRLTILYIVSSNTITYQISYCGFKDQFSRKKGVKTALLSNLRCFELSYKPNRSNNKIIALIMLNEVINHNQPRDFACIMTLKAHLLGFDV